MELLQFLRDTLIDWIRDIAINVSGRLAEEFLGKRAKRRNKRRRKLKRSR